MASKSNSGVGAQIRNETLGNPIRSRNLRLSADQAHFLIYRQSVLFCIIEDNEGKGAREYTGNKKGTEYAPVKLDCKQ